MMWNRSLSLPAAALLAASLAVHLGGQKNDRAEVLFESAQKKSFLDGNLQAAIEQYKKIVAEYGSHRSVAAKALVEMGRCYEKLGLAEARKAYERVTGEYSDQAEPARFARERLKSLPAVGEAAEAKPRLRLVMGTRPGETVRPLTLSPDGTQVAYTVLNRDDKDYGYEIWTSDFAGYHARRIARGFDAAWSPDGKSLVFVGTRRVENQASPKVGLWVRSLPDGAERLLVEMMCAGPAWSPDGKWIAFRAGPLNQRLHVVSAAGGEPRFLAESWTGSPARWSPDSRRIAFAQQHPSGGSATSYYDLKRDRAFRLTSAAPSDSPGGWSPDGKWVYFLSSREGSSNLWKTLISDETGEPVGTPIRMTEFQENVEAAMQTPDCRKTVMVLRKDARRIGVASADGSGTTRFLGEGRHPQWLDDEHLIFSKAGDLYATSLSGGEARRITSVGNIIDQSDWFRFALAPDRRSVAYLTSIPGQSKGRRLHVMSVPGGPARQALEAGFITFAWSPDSKALVAGYDGTVAVIPADKGEPRVLFTEGRPLDGWLHWCPGGAVLYAEYEPGPMDGIYLIPASGGQPRRLTNDPKSYHDRGVQCSPDGNRLAYLKVSPEHNDDLWILDLKTGKSELAAKSAMNPDWSPGGTRIAFESWRDGRRNIYAVDIRNGQIQRLTNAPEQESGPRWSPDGKSIAFWINRAERQLWLMDNP